CIFFFSSRRRHTRFSRDWSSDVCSSDLRFLKFLEEEAKGNADGYADFFKEFGYFLKEGAATDFSHKEKLAELLRFESSLTEPGKLTSLAEYVCRMKEGRSEERRLGKECTHQQAG